MKTGSDFCFAKFANQKSEPVFFNEDLVAQEKATENGVDVSHSAVQYVTKHLGLQVCAIARLTDLLQYLSTQGDVPGPNGAEAMSLKTHYQAVLAYRDRYGVD